MIVVDYFHWPHLGDWRFDPADWPDPAAMVRELAEMGVKLMVSVWPSVNPVGENHAEMRDQGLLITSEQGVPVHHLFPDRGFGGHALGVSFYDATDRRARDYLWSKVKRNYYDLGVRVWWLDACEPEIFPEQPGNLRFAAAVGVAGVQRFVARPAAQLTGVVIAQDGDRGRVRVQDVPVRIDHPDRLRDAVQDPLKDRADR
ncbi:hypothetical protein Misp01_63880 [Microtetraspora sp. NBRC 13810]|nr:hypothetical protein Misp01_63880 [Microtetraspora sp. NBRC 13810]